MHICDFDSTRTATRFRWAKILEKRRFKHKEHTMLLFFKWSFGKFLKSIKEFVHTIFSGSLFHIAGVRPKMF